MKLRFTHSTKEARNTQSFFFERPQKFSFLPGQYVYLTLLNLKGKDYRGPTRQFTISSSPTDTNFIRITTRLDGGSAYKKALASLKENDQVEIEGPTGTFILDEHVEGEIVFLAGGVGITPFISGLKYFKDKKVENFLNLIYTNSTPDDIPFYDGLSNHKDVATKLRVIFSVSRTPKRSNWPHMIGKIHSDMVKKVLNRKTVQSFFVCGPPGFVGKSEIILKGLGINGKYINIEKFTGY